MKLNKEFLMKSIIYRIIAFILMYIAGYIFTQKVSTSFLIAISEFIIKIICYYFYEVLWKKICKIINMKPIDPGR